MVTYWSCTTLLISKVIFQLFLNAQNADPQNVRRQPFSRSLYQLVGGVIHASSIFQSSFVPQAIRWMNLGEAARSLAEEPERSPLHRFGKGAARSGHRGALTQTEQLARLKRFGHIDARFIASC